MYQKYAFCTVAQSAVYFIDQRLRVFVGFLSSIELIECRSCPTSEAIAVLEQFCRYQVRTGPKRVEVGMNEPIGFGRYEYLFRLEVRHQ